MTEVRITLDSGLTQTQLDRAADRLTNLAPMFGAIGEYFLGRTRERFDSETAPDNTKWAQLAQSTIKSKQRRQTSGKTRNGGSRARTNAAPNAILKDTFLLRDTINYRVTPFSVAIGTPQKYGVFLQYGTARMPARPFLGVNAEDLVEVENIAIDAIELL